MDKFSVQERNPKDAYAQVVLFGSRIGDIIVEMMGFWFIGPWTSRLVDPCVRLGSRVLWP
jgi:hypothetical protein